MYKFLFWTLLIIVVLAGIAGGAYWFGQQQLLKAIKPPITVAPTGANNPMVTAPISGAPMAQVDKDLVIAGPNTVFFARNGDQVILKYRDKIYDESDQGQMQAVALNSGDFTWFALVDSPAGVPPGEFMKDEVFGLKSAPNKKDFAFIMRWAGIEAGNPDNTFYYIFSYTPGKLASLVMDKSNPNVFDHNYIPKLDVYNADSSALSLNMSPCWNCGGGVPSKMLLNVNNGKYTDIGRTSYFSWKAGMNYEYKDYVKVDCPPEQQMGECHEKPENLSLKTGTFAP